MFTTTLGFFGSPSIEPSATPPLDSFDQEALDMCAQRVSVRVGTSSVAMMHFHLTTEPLRA